MIIKGDSIEDLCSLFYLHGVVAWPVVCDCGISWSRDRYDTEIKGSVLASSDRYCESDANGSYWKSGQ